MLSQQKTQTEKDLQENGNKVFLTSQGEKFYCKEAFCEYLDSNFGKHKIRRDDFPSIEDFWDKVAQGLPDQELDTCNKIITFRTGGGLNNNFVPAIIKEANRRFEQIILGEKDANQRCSN